MMKFKFFNRHKKKSIKRPPAPSTIKPKNKTFKLLQTNRSQYQSNEDTKTINKFTDFNAKSKRQRDGKYSVYVRKEKSMKGRRKL